jgi:hypothetical protein
MVAEIDRLNNHHQMHHSYLITLKNRPFDPPSQKCLELLIPEQYLLLTLKTGISVKKVFQRK